MSTPQSIDATTKIIRDKMAANPDLVADIARQLGVPSRLIVGQYRNPFSILDEFDQWFEFQHRKHVLGHPTGNIVYDMLQNDLQGRKAETYADTNYSGFRFHARYDFGVARIEPRLLIDGRTA